MNARDLRLHFVPIKVGTIEPELEHHRGSAFAAAIKMKTVAAHIDQFAWRMKRLPIVPPARRLIDRPDSGRNEDKQQICHEHVFHSAQQRP